MGTKLDLACVLILSLFVTTATAATNPCDDPSVHSFKSSLYPFPIKYQLLPGKNPKNYPTLAYIQGGPGSKVISMEDANPRDFTVVRFDLPGVGCNDSPDLDMTQLNISTDAFAKLWIELFRELQITNVALHGRSYGTQLGTQLAHLLRSEKSIALHSVIFEGTTGPASLYPQWTYGYLEGWERERKLRPAITDEELMKEKPFGLTQDQLLGFVSNALARGYTADANGKTISNQIDYLVALLNPRLPLASRNAIADYAERARTLHAMDPHQEYLYRKISCLEANPSGIEWNFVWRAPHLAFPDKGFCDELAAKDNVYYDPANYQIDAPLFVFSGEQDPNTPAGGGIYLTDAIHQRERQFISVGQGGHSVLLGALAECSNALITAILARRQVTSADFATCVNKQIRIFNLAPGELLRKADASLNQTCEDYLTRIGYRPGS